MATCVCIYRHKGMFQCLSAPIESGMLCPVLVGDNVYFIDNTSVRACVCVCEVQLETHHSVL